MYRYIDIDIHVPTYTLGARADGGKRATEMRRVATARPHHASIYVYVDVCTMHQSMWMWMYA